MGEESETEKPEIKPSETEARVKTAAIREGTLPITIRTLGRVSSLRQTQASIMAIAQGRVEKILVHDGDQVSSGTVLLQMDPRFFQASLRNARSALALAQKEVQYAEETGLAQQQADLDLAAKQARARATQARADSDRVTGLFDKGLKSQKDALDSRQMADSSEQDAAAAEKKAAAYGRSGRGLDLARLRAKVEDARAALATTEIESQAATVVSPIAGQVTRVAISMGQSVEKGGLLVELRPSQGVGASFALTPDQAGRVKPGLAFTLSDAAGIRNFAGVILTVGAGLDPDTGLVPVEGVLDGVTQPAPFLGEVMQGEITVAASPKGFIVPASALSVSEEEVVIYRVEENHEAKKITVEILAKNSHEAVVGAPGLQAGQQVITDGNYNLPDGAGLAADDK